MASTSQENPYDSLIAECGDDPVRIQSHYEKHRQNRNQRQKDNILSSHFTGVEIDKVLYKLVNKEAYPGYVDPRHCLVFWARPTVSVKDLIGKIQDKLRDVAPNLWLMPVDNLHMTVLEITHSRTEPEISARVDLLEPQLSEIVNFTLTHRAKLIKPLLSFDSSAMALSFVPAASDNNSHNDRYTYLHLRRDLYDLCTSTGVEVDSRYVLPSAHLTVARFVSHQDTSSSPENGMDQHTPDPKKMALLIKRIEEINQWLEDNFWVQDSTALPLGGEWLVGQEQGIDCNRGTLWYGNGQRLLIGDGF